MTHVLVTGAGGFLGSVLCEQLLAEGYKVTAVDLLLHRVPSLLHLCHDPNFDFIRADARDMGVVGPLIAKADVLIPLAAIVGAGACARQPVAAETTNFDAIRDLNDRRSSNQLVVYPNTNSGYGTKSGEVVCTEDSPLEPITLYGKTKVNAELLLLEAENAITLRLATVFGSSSRMRLDLLVNHFTYAACTDRYVVIFEGHFKRNYIHIRDVADAFLHCITNRDKMVGHCYNAGLDDANLSKTELAEAIRAHIPGFVIHHAPIGEDPDKRNYIVSNARLREAGFEAKRSLDDGIVELRCAFGVMPFDYKNV